MKTSLNIDNKFIMISEMKNESIFQVLEYEQLLGGDDLSTLIEVGLMKNAKVRLRQVRIILQDSSVKLESGALSYIKGNIHIISKTSGATGLGWKFFKSKVTSESLIKPMFNGCGEIFLKPTFGNYALIELQDEETIVGEGMFFACEDSVEVDIVDNDGVFQTKLKGSGIVLLEIPVPEKEILRCKLYRDTLKVDGELVLLRTTNVDFSVEKSDTTVVGTAINGEEFLNVYSGTGEVWIAPTKEIYERLSLLGIAGRIDNINNNNNDTDT